MKLTELEKKLKEIGIKFERHGGNHDIWRAPNGGQVAVPRHREINEMTAKSILKRAKALVLDD